MQTHYNNLKVSRDAPIEVIRAAFRSLAAKYHPDLNPGNDEAARIMRIVARSYAVISDPVSRAQHDRWIMGVESAAEGRESPSAQRQPLRRPTESSPARPPCFCLEEQGRTGSWIVGISIFFVAIMSGIAFIPRRSVTAPANSIQTPTPSPVTPTVQELRGAPVPQPQIYSTVLRNAQMQNPLHYSRPALAPNGQLWPANSGYIFGYTNEAGNSEITIDNTQNGSDMLVKLFDRRFDRPVAVRIFFLRAREQFTLDGVMPGDYDIRYQDLDSGAISKSHPFLLEEREEDIRESDGRLGHGIRSTTYNLTLYEVMDGNTTSRIIGPDEFR